MDASLKTQLDIKNNVEDLHKYIAELKTWEAEIKEKEQALLGTSSPASQSQKMAPPRNKKPKNEVKSEKVPGKEQKIAGHDYKAWDKFDADKACREIEGSESKTNFLSSDDDDECDLPPPRKNIPPPTLKQVSKQSNQVPLENEKVDEEKERLKNIDLAFFEKELGNKLVKEEKWKDAIECYSKAVKFDPSNAIYYANRALCHIKLSNFKEAEVDSTVALQLDKTYLKAYQRRAFARKALKQYLEAISDYEQVLLLEPKNALARVEIDKINEYLAKADQVTTPTFNPKKMFGMEKPETVGKTNISKMEESGKEDEKVGKTGSSETKQKTKIAEVKKDKIKSSVFTTKLPEGCIAVDPISKLPHQRSKRPLQKVIVKQVDHSLGIDDLILPDIESNTQTKESGAEKGKAKIENVKVAGEEKIKNVKVAGEEKIETVKVAAEIKPAVDVAVTSKPSASQMNSEKPSLPPVPHTSVQFESSWKSIYGNHDLCYSFLKAIPSKSLKSIFGSCLESWLVSQMLATLSSDSSMGDPTFQYEFLGALSTVERFSSLALFLSPSDQQGVTTCCSNLAKHYPAEKIAQLKKLYDL